MGRTYLYSLRVVAPDEIDADTAGDIERDREPHDVTYESAVLRYLSSALYDGLTTIADALPEGWTARIDGGEVVT